MEGATIMPVTAESTADRPQATPATSAVRRTLEPADIGAVAELHGRLYAREHGVDLSFEADVARGLASAVSRGWPGPGEGVWIVEVDGGVVGSLGLTDEGDATARVRWFLLDPSVRGVGLGRRLLDELLEETRAAGHRRLELETFSDLTAAAHLYRERGFELVSEEPGPRWGRELVYQRYALEL